MKKLLIMSALLFTGTQIQAQTTVDTFYYSGTSELFTVEACMGPITFEVIAGSGGDANSVEGGFGGKVQGTLTFEPGDVLQINVGAAGLGETIDADGVYVGSGGVFSYSACGQAGTGGGASDIRLNGVELDHRVVVAGGGGGAGGNEDNPLVGGAGGGLIGGIGDNWPGWPDAGGKGGTQDTGGNLGIACCECETYTTSGSLGQGGEGSGDCAGGGGGGGGYYGGGGACFSAGGGGSSYTDPSATDVTHTPGHQNGEGMIILTYSTIVSETDLELSVCSEMISPSGLYTWTESGVYNDTLTTVLGCDSVLTVDLTVHTPSASSQTIAACNAMVSPSGLFTWTESGVYMDTIDNVLGCDSVLTIDLTINTVDVGVTNISEIELMAELEGATYQWINCDDNSDIDGATDQNFVATENGTYAVIITEGECSDTSDCISINSLSLIDHQNLTGTTIFPNPFDDAFTIIFDKKPNNAKVEIRDISGKLVHKQAATELLEAISFNGESGTYFVTITIDEAQKVHKIIKN